MRHDGNLPSKSVNDPSSEMSILDHQLGLLRFDDCTDAIDKGGLSTSDIRSAVLFSADMLEHCDESLLPQYGLLGSSTPKEGTFLFYSYLRSILYGIYRRQSH